jgi:uncharacterized DUF497 family protein
MGVVTDGFDWDSGNRAKCQKHGVTIAEIEAFLLGNPRIARDFKHSTHEERWLAVGRNREGRAMFVVFTFRNRDGLLLIQPLSARYMHRQEIDNYVSQSS